VFAAFHKTQYKEYSPFLPGHNFCSDPVMLTLLFALLVLALFVVFAFWLIGQIGVNPETAKMLRIVVAVIALLIILGWFAGLWGTGFKWR
jgi:magnesium-transporting ATPase (P-type)